ncbi:circularly permuted type 2 ATP-grasp protein [Antrihabitans sp. YC2-6]|uniref:circularly permuted type 2 ATP-grasp protein n=1 Tax=Antrihabitans sp. YC2-6 TaxID=2799498 RepID=UPI0027DE6E4A|nr:circularly permuted type 2 ATP-grasp protein [Antrihabitans sp. YC2-6]
MSSVLEDVISAYRSTLAPAALESGAAGVQARYDELLDADGHVREQWRELAESTGPIALSPLRARVHQLVENDGITYNEVSEADDGTPVTAPSQWLLDSLPLVLSATDWAPLEAGLVQRSRLLDALLADIYGPLHTIRRGLVPPELIYADPGYVRAAHGISVPARHQLFLHGADVARGADGSFRVVADRTQAPSGVGYALADRRVISRALPTVFADVRPLPLSGFAQAMRLALIDAAPEAVEDPVVVVLSPGAHSETAFDQAHLATVLGFPLVESADLVVREGRLWMRSLGTLARVDVVLRRVDAVFSDPLDLRPDSRLGVVGLVEVMRRGAVTVVNTLGSGVLENPGLPRLLPRLCRELLDEDLALPSVPRYWAGDPSELSHVLSRLDSLVLERVTGGPGILGAALTTQQRDDLGARIAAAPHLWVGVELPEHSSAPIEAGSAISSAPVQFRMFSVAQRGGYAALNGGLGAVISHRGRDGAIVSTSAKDVWVRPAERVTPAEAGSPSALTLPEAFPDLGPTAEPVTSPRVLDDLYWIGRYGERAEHTARLLNAVRDKVADYRYRPGRGGSDCLPVLFGAIAASAASGPVTFGVEEFDNQQRVLTIDLRRAGSLAQSVDRLQQASRAVRDQLSNDTWSVFSGLDRALAEAARSEDPLVLADAQRTILGGMLALSGLSAESMVHDAGWYLTDIGKRIERGLQLTKLLSSTLATVQPPSAERAIIESVLSATESSVTYRRRNRGKVRVGAVAQLLLFDGGNPRSLVYQLDKLRANLRALPDASGSSKAERLVEEVGARLRRADPSDLEEADSTGRRTELQELLDGVHASLRELSDILTEKMAVPTGMQPLWGATIVRRMP